MQKKLVFWWKTPFLAPWGREVVPSFKTNQANDRLYGFDKNCETDEGDNDADGDSDDDDDGGG